MNELDVAFIKENLNNDISKLLFKYSNDPKKKFLINQIDKRQKTKNKLPEFYNNFHFVFPSNSLAIEQCSSEATAKLKRNFFSGDKLLDLTGGLGIDSFYLSNNFNQIFYNEPNPELFEIAKQNYSHLNYKFFNNKSEDLVNELTEEFDLIYIDPDRRGKANQKLFKLEDLSPNILELYPKLKFRNLLVKLSPIFEIKEFSKHFNNYNIWIISSEGEVKELLLHISTEIKQNLIKILIINTNNVEEYNYEQKDETCELSDNDFSFLFELNPAILKGNLQESIAVENNFYKINRNTQYLFTNKIIKNLPGKYYKIIKKLKYNKQDFDKNGITTGIIKIRNFDNSITEIKQKLKIKESNSPYLFFTKDNYNKNICFVCERVI